MNSSLFWGHVVPFHPACADFGIIFATLVSECALFRSVVVCHVMVFLHDKNHVCIVLFPSPLTRRTGGASVWLVRAAAVQVVSDYCIGVSLACCESITLSNRGSGSGVVLSEYACQL